MSKEIPVKRQRIWSDTTEDPPTRSDSTKEKIKQLELMIQNVTHLNQTLETELNVRKINEDITAVDHNTEVKELELTIADLKARAIFHKERYDESKEILASMKLKHNEDINNVRDITEKQRQDIEELREKLDDEIFKSEELSSELSDVTLHYDSHVKKSHFKIENLEQQIEEKNSQIEASDEQKYKLEDTIRELESKILQLQSCETQNDDYDVLREENMCVTKQLLQLESTNKELTRELKHAKSITRNVELLRVERDSLTFKVNELEKVKEENYRLEMENANMKAERSAWATYLENNNDFNSQSPGFIISHLSKEAEKAKQIDSIKSYYQTQYEDQQAIIADMESHIEELKKKAINAEQIQAANESSQALINDNVEMLNRHIKILKNQLALYDHEEQTLMDEEKYDQIKSQRIAELQDLVRELELQLYKKNNEIAALISQNTPVIQITNGPYQKLLSGAKLTVKLAEVFEKEQKLFQELQSKIASEAIVQKRCDAATGLVEQLRNTLATHQHKNSDVPVSTQIIEDQETQTTTPTDATPKEAAASFDSTTQTQQQQGSGVRYVQFLNNPASVDYAIRKEHLRRLEQENKELVARLEGAESGETVEVPKITLSTLYARTEEAENIAKSKDKRIDRLKSIFGVKIDEVIDQIGRIFGFDLNFRGDNFVEVKSRFVDPADIYFMIKSKHDEKANIIDVLRVRGRKRDFYMHQWEDIYREHIMIDGNIPSFLMAIQTDLYITYRAIQREAYNYPDEVMEEHSSDEGIIEPYDEGVIEPYDEDTRLHLDEQSES